MSKEPSRDKSTKKFGLKPIELQMIKVLQDSYFNQLSNFLSFIALERLAYTVTQNTKYEIQDGNLIIEEVEPEAETKEEVSVP